MLFFNHLAVTRSFNTTKRGFGLINLFQQSLNSENPENKNTISPKISKKSIKSSSDPVPPFFGCRRHLELGGKVALVTGGTSGIGLAVACDLIENGVRRVIVAGRDVQAGARAIQHLNDLCDGADQEAVYVPTDVTSADDLKDLFNYTVTKHGGLDILMNSAGILNESARWKQMIDVNVKALIDSTKLCMTFMKNLKKPGVILNQSAIYAIKPLPQLPIFSATKAAVLSATLGFSKINNNQVRFLTACMGPTDTPMLLNFAHGDIGEWAKDQQENLIDVLKAKQNVEKAAKCITQMMEFADNGSICIVANGRLRKKEVEKPFKTRTFLKFE